MTVIRFDNVGMRYDMGDEVLRDVSFTIAPGDFCFLTGPSGAGKSTLLKMINLALRPSRGIITLFDQDTGGLPPKKWPALRRRIGVVYPDFRLIDHLSAFENVALALRISGANETQIGEYVPEMLRWVGLEARMNALPSTLSGGEKQRVAIARAVINRPELLIADEPTGNVDPTLSRRFMRLFSELNKLGTTVIIATHDERLMQKLPARELQLVDGTVIEAETATHD